MQTLNLIGGMKMPESIMKNMELAQIQYTEKVITKSVFIAKITFYINKLDESKKAKLLNHLVSQILEN